MGESGLGGDGDQGATPILQLNWTMALHLGHFKVHPQLSTLSLSPIYLQRWSLSSPYPLTLPSHPTPTSPFPLIAVEQFRYLVSSGIKQNKTFVQIIFVRTVVDGTSRQNFPLYGAEVDSGLVYPGTPLRDIFLIMAVLPVIYLMVEGVLVQTALTWSAAEIFRKEHKTVEVVVISSDYFYTVSMACVLHFITVMKKTSQTLNRNCSQQV